MSKMRQIVNPYAVFKYDRIVRKQSKCEECPLNTQRRIWGEGNIIRGSLVICGEGSGLEEDLEGRPFVGRSGNELNKILKEIGIDRYEHWVTNVLGCRPLNNKFDSPESVVAREKCDSGFEQEFSILQQNRFKIIASLGLNSSRKFGILGTMDEIHGRVYEWKGYKVIPTYHPSYIIHTHSPAITFKWKEDFKKIKEETLLATL